MRLPIAATLVVLALPVYAQFWSELANPRWRWRSPIPRSWASR